MEIEKLEYTDLINQIENIKNYEEKIKMLLNDKIIEKLTVYIFELFKSESIYRQKMFLNNQNFYKTVSPSLLYTYINGVNSNNLYNYLIIDNLINHIKQAGNITTLLEKIEDKNKLKKLIMKENIFKILEEENNYKPLLLFTEDKEIIEYIKNKKIKVNIKELYENNNYDNLNETEIKYILLKEKTDKIFKLLDIKKTKIILKGNPEILYEIFKNNIEKEKILKNQIFQNYITTEILDKIIPLIEHNISCIKIILEQPILLEQLDEYSLSTLLAFNSVELLEYLNNTNITEKISYKALENTIYMAQTYNIKSYLYFLLSKNIVKNINVIELFSKIKIEKKELDQIIEKVKLNKYKKILIYNTLKYKTNNIKEIENQIEEDINNYRSNEIIEELKEELKDESILSDIDIEPILEFLYKNPTFKITKAYFEIILSRLFRKITISSYPNIKLKIKNIYDEGIQKNNEIIINSQNIKDTLNKNIEIFSVFFHELIHAKQEKTIYNTYDYETFKQVKDELLRSIIDTYYDENYYNISTEVEAFIKGEIMSINYFYKKCKQIPDMEKRKKEIKEYCTNNKITDRKNDENIYSLEYLFDKIYTKEEIKKVIDIYPILLFEYNSDGTKKSLQELILLYSKAKYNLINKKTNKNIQIYVFYKRLLDDIMLKNQKIINEEEIIKYNEELKTIPYHSKETIYYKIYNEKLSEMKSYIPKTAILKKR